MQLEAKDLFDFVIELKGGLTGLPSIRASVASMAGTATAKLGLAAAIDPDSKCRKTKESSTGDPTPRGQTPGRTRRQWREQPACECSNTCANR
jgi:hypothetical protein